MPRYPMYYLLDEQGNPYPTDDSHAAGMLLSEPKKRRVDRTEKTIGEHEIDVSTVFLVHDHNHRILPEERDSPPILYETMLFIDGEAIGSATQRYETKEQAQTGHDEIVGRMEELLRMLLERDIDFEQVVGLLTK